MGKSNGHYLSWRVVLLKKQKKKTKQKLETSSY